MTWLGKNIKIYKFLVRALVLFVPSAVCHASFDKFQRWRRMSWCQIVMPNPPRIREQKLPALPRRFDGCLAANNIPQIVMLV
jgi:hypothetical protein